MILLSDIITLIYDIMNNKNMVNNEIYKLCFDHNGKKEIT